LRQPWSEAAEQLGGLDGLALNVGISHGLSLAKMTGEAWDKDFAVNVRSHMLFAQKALEVMAPGSAIILMSSMASQRANGRNPGYESSKAAQIALGRAIARAGEEKGIRCNVIAPGFMDTPMGRDASRRRSDRAVTVPFGRQGTGWEVAYAALFLISNESSYVNAHTLFLDGGHMAGIVRG
jgi:NAD(P)-dependent dehydrogenase (short-subunit alcohol dehydrogenase family)